MSMSTLVSLVIISAIVICGHGTSLGENCYDGNDGNTICWSGKEVDTYPTEKINDLLRTYSDGSGMFGPANNTSQNRPEGSCSLCNIERKIQIHPLVIKSQQRDRKELFVVNTERFRQVINVEICAKSQSDSKCQLGALRLNSNPNCEQKHTTIRFLVYDATTVSLKGKYINYPSKCVCKGNF